MTDLSYQKQRGRIQTYFDRTAVQAWARLTSEAPVGRIRATVRAGRDRMRATLMSWLPADLSGTRLLDAGCGTGALAVLAAQRGASVIAIDLSATLIQLASERRPVIAGGGSIEFHAGDMLDPAWGQFDYVVGMDSLIHYHLADAVQLLAELAPRTRRAMLFTFAPSSPLLRVFHAAGKVFPRSDRSPAIVPVAERSLHRRLDNSPHFAGWSRGRSLRIASGFYTSHAMEMHRR